MVVMASSISTPCELLSGTNAAGSGSASADIERAIILVLPLYYTLPALEGNSTETALATYSRTLGKRTKTVFVCKTVVD